MELKEKIADLNNLVLQGRMLDAFDKYYHENVAMQENNLEPMVGKKANRLREEQFVNNITDFRGAEVKSVAVGENVTMVEWFMDYTHKEWGDKKYTQVAVQHWQDGKIIKETFYYGN